MDACPVFIRLYYIIIKNILKTSCSDQTPSLVILPELLKSGVIVEGSGVLSALPLVAIGSVVAWVALRVRAAAKLEREDEARRVTRYGSNVR